MRQARFFLLLLTLLYLSLSIATAQAIIPIAYGQPATAVLDSGNRQSTASFTFSGTAGETIYATASSVEQNFEIEARLFNGFGVLLAEGDVFAQWTRTLVFELPEDGSYSIAVTTPDWEANSGAIELYLNMLESQAMEFGTVVEGTFENRGEMIQLIFTGEKGELFAYETFGATLGVFLFAPSGELFTQESFYDSPRDPLNRLPENGDYTLILQTLNPDPTDYAIVLHQPEPIPIVIGETFSGTFLESDGALFSFEGVSGKPVEINAELPPGGNTMTLISLDVENDWERRLFVDGGSGPNGNPRIQNFDVPLDGTYYLALSIDDFAPGNAEINYTISVMPDTILSIAPGVEIMGSASVDTGDVVYSYIGTGGQELRVTITQSSEVGGIFLGIFGEVDEVLNFGSRNVDTATFDIEIPFDGNYAFVIRNIDYDPNNTLEYSLLVEVVEQ